MGTKTNRKISAAAEKYLSMDAAAAKLFAAAVIDNVDALGINVNRLSNCYESLRRSTDAVLELYFEGRWKEGNKEADRFALVYVFADGKCSIAKSELRSYYKSDPRWDSGSCGSTPNDELLEEFEAEIRAPSDPFDEMFDEYFDEEFEYEGESDD